VYTDSLFYVDEKTPLRGHGCKWDEMIDLWS